MKTRLIPLYLLGLFPSLTFAQTISTGPLNALPVNNPWMLAALVLLIAACALWLLGKNRHGGVIASILLLGVASALLWQAPALKAQALSFVFSNPNGETLPITVHYEEDASGFEAIAYTNTSGVALRIHRIELPTFEQCFPDGLLPLDSQPPIAGSLCSEGQILRNSNTCQVDVHSACEGYATGFTATISINPATLMFSENATGEVTITNSAGSPVAANNVVAMIPGGSNISTQSTTCGASLAIGASCTITFTSPIQEGPTNILVAGDNTNTVNVVVTVTSQPQITITGPVQQSRVMAVSGASLALEITNDAGSSVNATAVTVTNKTACPNVTVDDSDCASLAPGDSCTLELTSGTPYAPCTLTISGANTANSPQTLVAFSHLGGLVFEESGGSGKVVVDVAQGSSRWTSSNSNIAGAASLDNGEANTNAIVVDAACSNDPPNCAAQRCRNISADWYLPARNELSAIHGSLCSSLVIPCEFGDFSSVFYRSSTQFDVSFAWMVNFPLGITDVAAKTVVSPLLCARSFTP